MLTGVTAFLLLLIALLAIPLTLQFDVSSRKSARNDVKLGWAFGLVRVQIPSFRSKARYPGDKKAEQNPDRSRRSRDKGRNTFGVFLEKRFRQRIVRFVGDLWQVISKKDICLSVRIGLGDPADTGELWAVAGPVAGVLAAVQGASINVEPEFFDRTFQVDTSGSIRLVPLQVIYLVIALLLSPPVLRGFRRLRNEGR